MRTTDRADALLKLMRSKKWYSRAALSIELGIDAKQVTRTFVLLREKGHKFLREKMDHGRYYLYKLDETGDGNFPKNKKHVEVENLKLIAEINKIRIASEDFGYARITTMCEKALITFGLYENS